MYQGPKGSKWLPWFKLSYEDPDLVGISFMTANASRAYEISKAFRARGKTVVMGGVHPTILPEEALQYADSVVAGEAEGVWNELLDDLQHNELKTKYHDAGADLGEYVPKDFSGIIKRRLFNLVPIQTSRGCPYNCDFCSVTDLFGKKIRHVPVEHVVRDIKESGAKNFIFLDDNIIGHPEYAKKLFKAIRPQNIHWVGQASVSLLARDDELMELAADSGCKSLFLGLESVSEAQLMNMRKTFKEIDQLSNALKRIRKMGILVHASMILGFDTDTPEVFEDTVKFLIRNNVSTVSFNVLTPYPGTKIFKDMEKEGRLLTRDWRYYDHNTVVFAPKNMTPYELQAEKVHARKRFYGWGSILRRFPGNRFSPLLYLLTNRGHRKQAKVEMNRLPELREKLQQAASDLNSSVPAFRRMEYSSSSSA